MKNFLSVSVLVLCIAFSPTTLHAQTVNDLYNYALSIQKKLNSFVPASNIRKNVAAVSSANVVTTASPALPQRYVDTTIPNQTISVPLPFNPVPPIATPFPPVVTPPLPFNPVPLVAVTD